MPDDWTSPIDESTGADLIAKVATTIAVRLISAAASRLRDAGLGTTQQRALQEAFETALRTSLPTLAEPADRAHLDTVLHDFVADPFVAEQLVDAALRRRPLEIEPLRRRFVELGFDPDTLPVAFDAGMATLAADLETATAVVAARDTPGLFALATLSGLDGLHQQVDRLLAGLLAVPSAPEAGIRRFLGDYLGRPGRPMPFGGRDAELAELRDWVAGPGSGYALVLAPAGRGKSSLLAHLAAGMSDDPATDVIFVPVSLRQPRLRGARRVPGTGAPPPARRGRRPGRLVAARRYRAPLAPALARAPDRRRARRRRRGERLGYGPGRAPRRAPGGRARDRVRA
jgi:hypothetical protein